METKPSAPAKRSSVAITAIGIIIALAPWLYVAPFLFFMSIFIFDNPSNEAVAYLLFFALNGTSVALPLVCAFLGYLLRERRPALSYFFFLFPNILGIAFWTWVFYL